MNNKLTVFSEQLANRQSIKDISNLLTDYWLTLRPLVHCVWYLIHLRIDSQPNKQSTDCQHNFNFYFLMTFIKNLSTVLNNLSVCSLLFIVLLWKLVTGFFAFATDLQHLSYFFSGYFTCAPDGFKLVYSNM